MGTILITSRLGMDYRDDLEQAMFFNPRQHRAEAAIRESVECYGMPEIMTENGYLRIRVNPFTTAQTLFTIDRTETGDVLAGVLVYVRDASHALSVLHIAVTRDYLVKGPVTSARLVWSMLRQVTEAAARISGIRYVRLIYGNIRGNGKNSFNNIPVIRRRDNNREKALMQPAHCPDEAITCYEYQQCHECPQKVISKIRGSLAQTI